MTDELPPAQPTPPTPFDQRMDGIEDLLRHLLAALIKMNARLDVICGKELK
jgi:hypothetical protein